MSRKIVFCWADISGYMAACWRALQELPGVDIYVIAFAARTETLFSDQLMEGIPCSLLDVEERHNERLIESLVRQQNPDVIYLSGWFHQPYRQLAFTPKLGNIKKIMGMDTPWWGTLKQHLAPWLLRSYLQRIDKVVVTGERSWQYALRLGLEPEKISRGLYGIDYDTWFPLWQRRVEQPNWPRSFLFVGRYASAKAVDILVQGYHLYSSQVSQPWQLICCGQGPLGERLEGNPGIKNMGFVQPTDMIDIWQNAGAFILPSRFDPWPLALVEAAASGLPIVCTDACGSAVEVIRPWYNGLIIPKENPKALADALFTLHQRHADLHIWGKRSQHLAAPYDTKIWAQSWQEILFEGDFLKRRSYQNVA
ncbi:MAG: glycosyltransferase family 4 protein [Cyanobacteria bacterium P01_A01_bin.84]